MFDGHLNGQHRLSYLSRGPEWAFAIPKGDIDALAEVMELCSYFWNGAGSLIVPVTKSGQIGDGIDVLLETRNVDACWFHSSLNAKAREAVRRRFPKSQELHGEFDRREVHPLLLVPEPMPDALKTSLMIPRFEDRKMELLTLATWGRVDPEDVPVWRSRFDIAEIGDEEAMRTLVRGQTGQSASPLSTTAIGMGMIEQSGPQDWPYLCVFPEVTFQKLVTFWNVRSRTYSRAVGMPVVGVTQSMLKTNGVLEPIERWAVSEYEQRTPELLVSTSESANEVVTASLAKAGFDRDQGDSLTTSFGSKVERRERPAFRFMTLIVGGSLVRGSHGTTLVAVDDGKISVSLEQTTPVPLTGGHIVHVGLRDLPLPLPSTDSLARLVHHNASAADGVMLNLGSQAGPWNLDLKIPSREDALGPWAKDHGYETQPTQDGRYAEALINRLGDGAAIDALADELRVGVLRQLAPLSRLKLAQRLTREGEKKGLDLSEATLIDAMKDIALFLELEARTSGALASDLNSTKKRVLESLEPLVEQGFVVRGQRTECSRCRFRRVISLQELDEALVCSACGHKYVWPVSADDGRKEPEFVYRLDGLMARAMDQDVLPVLLAMRAARKHLGGEHYFAWTGLEMKAAGKNPVDVDLLCSNGRQVIGIEAKDNAASLDVKQVDKVLPIVEALGARFGVAGLRGTFSEEVKAAVREAGGLIFEERDLLAEGPGLVL